MTLLQIKGAFLYEAANKMQQSKLLFHLMSFPYNHCQSVITSATKANSLGLEFYVRFFGYL